jgi:integrase/recombinase XerD
MTRKPKKIAPEKTAGEIVPAHQLTRVGLTSLPAPIVEAGEKVTRCFLEFFTATIRNRNTRFAYARAVAQFFAWCEERGVSLANLQPMIVAAYIEHHPAAIPTVKQHMAAIRMLFDWMVTGGVLPMNPASSVRGPKYVVKRGKTPVLSSDQIRTLLESIDTGTIVGLRDRAILATMLYTFARVSAVVNMRVEDYFQDGKRWWFRLHEKGGKRHEVPVHHKAEEYIDAYLSSADISHTKHAPLFRSINKHRQLTEAPLYRVDVFRMIKRRAKEAGLPPSMCCHACRATGITVYLENGGTLENAQAIANHASAKTTKLYDRRGDAITLDEVERIVF